MKLYQEIILLKHYFRGKWCVENVISFYDPLVPPTVLNGHYFWSNFLIPTMLSYNDNRNHGGTVETLEKRKGFDLRDKKLEKRKALRNCVEPELGKHILHYAFNSYETNYKIFA